MMRCHVFRAFSTDRKPFELSGVPSTVLPDTTGPKRCRALPKANMDGPLLKWMGRRFSSSPVSFSFIKCHVGLTVRQDAKLFATIMWCNACGRWLTNHRIIGPICSVAPMQFMWKEPSSGIRGNISLLGFVAWAGLGLVANKYNLIRICVDQDHVCHSRLDGGQWLQ